MKALSVLYIVFFAFYFISCADTPNDSLYGQEGYKCKAEAVCDVGLLCVDDKCEKDNCFGITCDSWKVCSQETQECILQEGSCITSDNCLNNSEGKLICDVNSHTCTSDASECTNDEKRCSVDARSMETCVNQKWEVSNCQANEECIGGGSGVICKILECIAGEKRCSAINDKIQVCNSTNDAWDLFEECGEQKKCKEEANAFACVSCNECDPNSFVATCNENTGASCDLIDGCYKEVQFDCLIGENCKINESTASVAFCECKNDCFDEAGATCSSDSDNLLICEKNANNCFYKRAELICAQDESCVVDSINHTASCECVNECIPSSTKCTDDGTEIIACERNGNNGCYYWGTPSETCGSGSSCLEHDNTATCDCTSECDSTQFNQSSCSDDVLSIQKCMKNSVNNCYYFSQVETCTRGNACSQAEGESPTCNNACTDECLQNQSNNRICSDDFKSILYCDNGNYNQIENRTCYYWRLNRNCSSNQECVVSSIAYVNCTNIPVCITDEKRCSDDKTKIEKCIYNSSWTNDVSCNDGEICVENGDSVVCEIEKKKAGEECNSNNECTGNRWCLGGENVVHYCFTECYEASSSDAEFCGGEACVPLEDNEGKFYCKQVPSRDTQDECNEGNTCLNGAWCLSVGEKSNCFTSCNISSTTCTEQETCTSLALGVSFCKPECLSNDDCAENERCNLDTFDCVAFIEVDACNDNTECLDNTNNKTACVSSHCVDPIEMTACTEDGNECVDNTNEKLVCLNSICTERIEVTVCASTAECAHNTNRKVVCVSDECVEPQ